MDDAIGSIDVKAFTIDVADGVLSNLRARLRNTWWPPPAPGAAWEQGTDLDFLERLLEYWITAFDWRQREAELNRFHHFRADVDGIPIHFVHERARDGKGVPLILTHGWPSAFIEYLPLVPLLTDPAAHGIGAQFRRRDSLAARLRVFRQTCARELPERGAALVSLDARARISALRRRRRRFRRGSGYVD